MADDKDQQFTRMWNEENKSKRAKFRNLMKAKLDVLHVEVKGTTTAGTDVIRLYATECG